MVGVGDVVEHYRIEALLGEGGMGRVYRAFDTRLERQVALKLLLAGGGADASARLVREARAAAALEHPNAVHVYAVGSHEDAPYIAMELVRGQTLRQRLEASVKAPLEVRLGWLVDVAQALAAAHALGIVHRDIKPDNVMIRDDGRVKVLDFGIARRVAARVDPSAPTDGAAPTVTAAGAAIGTPAYMAPEQIRGLPIDARADQFAWAVTAYETLAGARPWEGDALALVAAVVSDPAPPLDDRAPGLPRGVGGIVGRALEKRPEDRFASMDELLEALEPLGARQGSVGPTSKARAADVEATPRSRASTVSATTEARPEAAPGKQPLWRRAALPIAAMGCAAFLLASGRDRRQPPTAEAAASAPSPSTSAAASASSPPIGPALPATTPPDAARAFANAMTLWRTRSEALAVAQLERAVEADPTLAPAQLRYALFSFGEGPSEARNHLQKAQDMRATLDPREAAFLDAALAYMAEPPDVAGFAARLEPLLAKDPRDIEARYWLATTERLRGQSAKARKTLERALEIDPAFAPAASQIADIQSNEEGDFEGALATAKACLALNPGSALCIGSQVGVLGMLGRCEEAETRARSWAATMPEHPGAFYQLAAILEGRDRPLESVQESLAASGERLRPSQRELAMTWDRAKLAMARGAFDEAERGFAAAERLLPSRAEVGVRSALVTSRATLYLEEGRGREAGEFAEALLKRESALTRTSLATWRGIAFDPMLRIVSIAAHHGSLPKAELDRRRAAWLAEQEKAIAGREDPDLRMALWAHAWVGTAETPEEAKAALAKFEGKLSPVADAFPETLADIGRVHLLAGDAAGAVPLLRRAVRNCQPIEHPLVLVRARAELGEALEATGDKAGARLAYEALLARWGNAKPKSVTAERVKARMKALGN